MKNGFGKEYDILGNIYEGNFYLNVREGKGRLIYENGDIYRGDFSNGVREGQGHMIWTSENREYIGGFLNDKENGQG